MAAAAIVFFAFYGFDAVATSAEEAKNPKRDLTIGILGSMLVCTLIYMGVAITAVGALPFQQLANSTEPLALVLRALDQPVAAHRSEEHTSELQSLMRISYAVFCLTKKKTQ